MNFRNVLEEVKRASEREREREREREGIVTHNTNSHHDLSRNQADTPEPWALQ